MTWAEYKQSLPKAELETIFVENRKASPGYNKHYQLYKRANDAKFALLEKMNRKLRYEKRNEAQKENDRRRVRMSQAAYKKRHPNRIDRFFDNLRSRTRNYLKNSGLRTSELLGCSQNEFKAHLESQFTDGMNWGNYGYGLDKWTLDHIIPLATSKREDGSIDRELCIKLSHYTNLRPMWLSENCSKGARLR